MTAVSNWYGIIALLAGFVLARAVPAIVQPSPDPVRAAVRRSITALIFLDAAACYAGTGELYALLVAVLVVPTTFLGRWIRPGIGEGRRGEGELQLPTRDARMGMI